MDKDTYKDYLVETRKLLIEAQDAAFDLRSKLDITSDDDAGRIQEIKQLESKLTMLQMAMWDCIDKAHDIQNKMVELKANVPGIDVGAGPVTNGEAEREARHRHHWHNM